MRNPLVIPFPRKREHSPFRLRQFHSAHPAPTGADRWETSRRCWDPSHSDLQGTDEVLNQDNRARVRVARMLGWGSEGRGFESERGDLLHRRAKTPKPKRSVPSARTPILPALSSHRDSPQRAHAHERTPRTGTARKRDDLAIARCQNTDSGGNPCHCSPAHCDASPRTGPAPTAPPPMGTRSTARRTNARARRGRHRSRMPRMRRPRTRGVRAQGGLRSWGQRSVARSPTLNETRPTAGWAASQAAGTPPNSRGTPPRLVGEAPVAPIPTMPPHSRLQREGPRLKSPKDFRRKSFKILRGLHPGQSTSDWPGCNPRRIFAISSKNTGILRKTAAPNRVAAQTRPAMYKAAALRAAAPQHPLPPHPRPRPPPSTSNWPRGNHRRIFVFSSKMCSMITWWSVFGWC